MQQTPLTITPRRQPRFWFRTFVAYYSLYCYRCSVISVSVCAGQNHELSTDNIKTWTGLPVEESVRMTVDKDKITEKVRRRCGQPSDGGRLKNRAIY